MGNSAADPANGIVPPVSVPQSCAGIEKIASTLKPQALATYLDFEGKVLEW